LWDAFCILFSFQKTIECDLIFEKLPGKALNKDENISYWQFGLLSLRQVYLPIYFNFGNGIALINTFAKK